jgi:hypothetical protein
MVYTSTYYCMPHRCWTIEELYAELDRFRKVLTDAGKEPNTIATYTDRAERYLRWLEGKYHPR